MKRLSIIILFISLGVAQSNYPTQLVLSAPPPPAPSNVSVSFTGVGNSTAYYWIVANYPIGKSPVSRYAMIYNANDTSTVFISWDKMVGATSYDILRTTVPQFPGSCTCAVATVQSSTTYTDTLNSSLSSYTLTSVGTATYIMYLDNQNYATPTVVNVGASLPGTGTVTNFSVAACPPYLNCTVANPGSTPAITIANGTGLATHSFVGTGSATSLSLRQPSFTDLVGLINVSTQIPTSGATAGTYGDSTHCITETVTAQGIVTSISQTACAGGGGGGASNATQLTDFLLTRTNATTMTLSYPTGGSLINSGGVNTSFNTQVTCTPQGASSQGAFPTNFYFYYDPATNGLKIDTNGTDFIGGSGYTGLTCSPGGNITLANTGVNTNPPLTYLIAILTANGDVINQWDTNSPNAFPSPNNTKGVLLARSIFNSWITTNDPSGNLTCAVDIHGRNLCYPDLTKSWPFTGILSANQGFQDTSVAARSTCNSGLRGRYYIEKGTGTNGADQPIICEQTNSTGPTYAWVPTGSGGGGGTSVVESVFNGPLVVCNGGSATGQNWSALGTINSQCNYVGAAGGSDASQDIVGLMSSGANTDSILYSFSTPTNLNSISVVLNGFPGSSTSNSLTWTAKIGCIAANGATFSGGSQNAGTAATVSSTTTDTTIQFTLSSIAITGCNADDQMYLRINRSGTYTGNYYLTSAKIRANRNLP